MTSKVYRIYIPSSRIVIESVHVKFNENANIETEKDIDITGVELPTNKRWWNITNIDRNQRVKCTFSFSCIREPCANLDARYYPEWGASVREGWILVSPEFQVSIVLREVLSHLLSNVIGNLREKVRTRSGLNQIIVHYAFVSYVQPKTFKEVNIDPHWICAMQEKLAQFKRNKIWKVVPRPKDRMIITLTPGHVMCSLKVSFYLPRRLEKLSEDFGTSFLVDSCPGATGWWCFSVRWILLSI
jgi:hypothetical protein